MNQRTYLDSSIVLKRQFASEQHQNEINKVIGDSEKLASKYVKMECLRTFLKDAIYLHSLLVEEKSFSAALLRLSYIEAKPRVKDRCFALLSWIDKYYESNASAAIAGLTCLIEGFEDLLFQDVRLLPTGTECPLANEKPEFIDPGYVLHDRCNRQEPNCRIVAFLSLNRAKLEQIKDQIVGVPPLKDLSDLLATLLQIDLGRAKGENCMILGDLVICLDAPNDCRIVSDNVPHFDPICKALGKVFEPVRLVYPKRLKRS